MKKRRMSDQMQTEIEEPGTRHENRGPLHSTKHRKQLVSCNTHVTWRHLAAPECTLLRGQVQNGACSCTYSFCPVCFGENELIKTPFLAAKSARETGCYRRLEAKSGILAIIWIPWQAMVGCAFQSHTGLHSCCRNPLVFLMSPSIFLRLRFHHAARCQILVPLTVAPARQ